MGLFYEYSMKCTKHNVEITDADKFPDNPCHLCRQEEAQKNAKELVYKIDKAHKNAGKSKLHFP